MASGIVSVGTQALGYPVVSDVTLAVGVAAFVGLVLADAARAIWFTPFFARSLRDPSATIGYFSFVAGTNVLGVRFAMAGYPGLTAALALAAAAAWLLLNYWLPWSM
ncbi:MAG: tellurite resistance/C4-dicarboxylate transporter family protein, partial [Acidimicrobiales bacterium]